MEVFYFPAAANWIILRHMTAVFKKKVNARIKAMGVSRRWLAEECGYSYFSIRDALAPKGKKSCRRLHDAIERALSNYHPTKK